MSRVVALELDSATLSALEREAATWGVELEQAAESVDVERLGDGAEIALLVVGQVPDPIRTAQRVHRAAPGLPVVLVAPADECSALAERLRYSVFVGPNVRCLAREPSLALLEEIGTELDRGRRRAGHRRTIAALNRKVGVWTGGPRSEAILGRLLEVAPIGVVVCDDDGAIQALNLRAAQFLGGPDDELRGQPVWAPFPTDQRGPFGELLSRLNGDPAAQPRATFARGEPPVQLEVTGARLPGEGRGYLLLFTDVSERYQLINELERANRRKDEFLAMLGHELRNPLAPIRTALELMRLRAPDVTQRERAIIERQVDHLVVLVDDLLDVSRITRGKLSLRKEHLEVAPVIGKAIEMTAPLLEERRHQVSVEVPDRGLVLHADPGRLAQVVANLLSNAAKYTPPGGSIEIAARRDGDEVVVEVRDSGPGIEPELLPRIFDLFVQKTQDIDRASGGLGIGLAIVRSLVELHQGSVSVESTAGRGSVFVLRFPAADADHAVRAGSPGASAGRRAAGGPDGAQRILVVDDNRDAALLLRDLLQSFGHEVAVAYDGPEALAMIGDFAPTIALLDIGLPVMDGYELAVQLRQLPALAGLRLIAVSGYGAVTDRERSRAAGFDEHLVKPIDLDALRAALGRAGRATPGA